jgi:hypothetical protein
MQNYAKNFFFTPKKMRAFGLNSTLAWIRSLLITESNVIKSSLSIRSIVSWCKGMQKKINRKKTHALIWDRAQISASKKEKATFQIERNVALS